VLGLREVGVNATQLACANKVVRKVTGYMNTHTPPSRTVAGGGNGPSGEVDFAAARLARVLYAPAGRLEAETEADLKRFFLNDDYQSIYYSENHMFMFRTARYLAACRYEGETFHQYGMTAEEMRKQEHDYLIEFLQIRAKRGWGEFDSMGFHRELPQSPQSLRLRTGRGSGRDRPDVAGLFAYEHDRGYHGERNVRRCPRTELRLRG